MTVRSSPSGLALWPIFILLLLAIRAPAETVQDSGAQPDAARGPRAANRPDVAARKPAWKWTVEERLAKRFDPEAMAARVRDHDSRQKAIQALRPPDEDPLFKVDDQARRPADVINGKRTPELFLTYELFNFLLDSGLPADGHIRSESRGPIEARAAALGFGQDLWPRLEKAAAPFLDLRREAERLRISHNASLAEFKKDSQAMHWCRTRAQAIASAKAEFGEEPFLRLLYEAVAPNIDMRSFLGSEPADLGKHLRFLEGGCQ